MVTLKIDNEEESVSEQIVYLEEVIHRLKRGYISGKGWDVDGEDEDVDELESDDDEDEEELDDEEETE